MDSIEQLMVFYKYRGFSSRMSEGFRFLTKNMKVILKTSLWVLLPISLIQALVYSMYAESVMEFSTMAGKTPDALQAYGAVAVQLLLIWLVAFVGSVLWGALVFGMFRKYSMLGYVPAMSIGAWFAWTRRDIWRFFLCLLFVVFFIVILMALSIMFMTLSAWTLIVVLPLWIYMGVILAIFPYFYIMESNPLWSAFVMAVRKGTPSWGAGFGICVLGMILAGIFGVICSLPSTITLIIDYFVALGGQDGEVAQLPAYYGVLKFLFYALSMYGGYLQMLIWGAPLLFHYSSLMAHDKEKELADALAEQERMKAEQERIQAQKKRESEFLSGSSYKPF